MPRPRTGQLPIQEIRVPAADWADFGALHGRKAPEAIRQFVAWQLHRPGAQLPARPPPPGDGQRGQVPEEVIEQFRAWYLRHPGAQLPRRPGGETPVQHVRIPAADWADFGALHGRKAPEAIRQFVAWQLHRPGAQLPARPPPAGRSGGGPAPGAHLPHLRPEARGLSSELM